MLKPVTLILGAAFAVLLVSAPSADTAPSFSKDIAPIFRSACASCHRSNDEPGNFSLAPSAAYRELLKPSFESAMPRVSPGNPKKSYLLHKLRGTQSGAGGNGQQMPLGGSPLPPDAIDKISQWIGAGAPNN